MTNGFRHDLFEQWRRERHRLASPIGAPSMAPWITLDLDETVSMFLADVPEAQPHADAVLEYVRARYPHGVHIRSNAAAASDS